MTCDRSVASPVSSTNETDNHDITDIVETGVKHHKPKPTNSWHIYTRLPQGSILSLKVYANWY